MAKITIDPNPAQEGKPCTICYDFDGQPDDSVTIDITWTPDTITDPSSVTVTRTENCKTITIPSGATNWLLEDATGVAPDAGGTITPA